MIIALRDLSDHTCICGDRIPYSILRCVSASSRLHGPAGVREAIPGTSGHSDAAPRLLIHLGCVRLDTRVTDRVALGHRAVARRGGRAEGARVWTNPLGCQSTSWGKYPVGWQNLIGHTGGAMVSMCGLAEKKTQANADHILDTGGVHCTKGAPL